MTDKELRMGYIGWSPDFREYKDIKARKTVVGRVVTKQEWEAALTTAYREGLEAMLDAAMRHKNGGSWPEDRDQIPVDELLEEAARLLGEKP